MERSFEAAELNVYRVQGLSCTQCSARFEQNVKQLQGVQDARVNFGASKLTVIGSTSIEELEKAGSFDGIKVYPEQQKEVIPRPSIWRRRATIQTLISFLFLALGLSYTLIFRESNITSTLLYATSIVIGGYSLFLQGLNNLVRLKFDMNTLMTVAIIGASLIGEWQEGAIVVILFAISEALEEYSMDRARQSIRSLMELAPKEAVVKRGTEQIQIPVEHIQIGDILLVKPGQKIAMDGIVVGGSSAVNQATITGESMPVMKAMGDEVYAGTLNEEGMLEVEVTKTVNDTTLAKIIHLVEEAQAEKAPSQAFVERFAQYYTPLIMLVALATILIPPLLFQGDWGKWVYEGLAILVVGCPCALVVSTPVAIVTAIGNSAKHGVLIKGGVYLEETGGLRVVAFDKTGTITQGRPEVVDFINISDREDQELWTVIAGIEQFSQHPIASAIIRKVETLKMDYQQAQVTDFSSVTGKGAMGMMDGRIYHIGNPQWFKELHYWLSEKMLDQIAKLQQQGKTVILLGTEREVLAMIAVADQIREHSPSVIRKLKQLGIKKTVLLTGDNQATAKAIGEQVGISEVQAELLPEDKLNAIQELQRRYGKVAMVGDGVNDAPALASATIGVAMGGAGTDTALETADIALMADDLSKLPYTIKLSRKTLNIIKQNITFSLALKLFALLLVIPGMLTLWIAIIADMGATLLVVLNSMRLLRVKED